VEGMMGSTLADVENILLEHESSLEVSYRHLVLWDFCSARTSMMNHELSLGTLTDIFTL
jgi:hypothetical protein